jgi:tryptophanyl-tRNA synthetase
MLTTKNSPGDIAAIGVNARDMVLDSLAAGLDPAHSVFYLQSAIPEVAEISLLLQSLITSMIQRQVRDGRRFAR